MPNLNDPLYDEPREHPGFRCRRARISRQAGSERLGLSVWELPPGEAACPYHHHLGEEELLVVLDGRPALRSAEGWRDLKEGEVVAFLRGEGGGHQLVNRTRETVRFLAFSTNGEPDIVIYPTRGKPGRMDESRTAAGCAHCSGWAMPWTTTTGSARPTRLDVELVRSERPWSADRDDCLPADATVWPSPWRPRAVLAAV